MLELKNISVGYGRKTVLSGMTASFERGRLTSVIGRNGCGKSTLLKAAVGILPVSEGDILIDGEALVKARRTEVAKRVSYLSQGKSTPDMTVMQMVLHGRFPYLKYPRRYTEEDRRIAGEAMKALGISELACRPLHTLSGGMRQKVYIAMVLAQQTDYILLDEPTTYLDIAHQLELMKILRSLAEEGKGIIAVMHDLTLAFELSDEIAVMDNGGIAVQATPEEVCRSSAIGEIFGVNIKRDPEKNRFFYEARGIGATHI